LNIVSERLGHAKTSITLDVNGHLLPGMQERAVASIGVALFGVWHVSAAACGTGIALSAA
jgi:hypothetical protein